MANPNQGYTQSGFWAVTDPAQMVFSVPVWEIWVNKSAGVLRFIRSPNPIPAELSPTYFEHVIGDVAPPDNMLNLDNGEGGAYMFPFMNNGSYQVTPPDPLGTFLLTTAQLATGTTFDFFVAEWATGPVTQGNFATCFGGMLAGREDGKGKLLLLSKGPQTDAPLMLNLTAVDHTHGEGYITMSFSFDSKDLLRVRQLGNAGTPFYVEMYNEFGVPVKTQPTLNDAPRDGNDFFILSIYDDGNVFSGTQRVSLFSDDQFANMIGTGIIPTVVPPDSVTPPIVLVPGTVDIFYAGKTSFLASYTMDNGVADVRGIAPVPESNNVTAVPGRFDSGLLFDNLQDSYVRLGALGISKPTDRFTIMFWFKVSDPNRPQIIMCNGNGDASHLGRFDVNIWFSPYAAGQLAFALSAAQYNFFLHRRTNGFNFIPNQWYHAAFTYDGSGIDAGGRLFINGNDVSVIGEYADGPIAGDPVDEWMIGNGNFTSRTTDSGFSGVLDEIGVFSEVLTPTEILNYYNWCITPQSVFKTPGEFNYVVPEGVTQVDVEAWGAGGGSKDFASVAGGTSEALGVTDGGGGGYIAGTIAVTPGEILRVRVGGTGVGLPVGETWPAGVGGQTSTNVLPSGGASFVKRFDGTLLFIAAGGGGSYANTIGFGSFGGAGGGLEGQSGQQDNAGYSNGGPGGAGGTQTSGYLDPDYRGEQGSDRSGSGGGGFRGGRAGSMGASGGGGSSWAHADATNVQNIGGNYTDPGNAISGTRAANYPKAGENAEDGLIVIVPSLPV